jgi:ribonuclease VapC
MVVDTSALVAILAGEPERRTFIEAIEAAETRLLSAASFVEASIVLDGRHGAEGVRHLDLFIDRAGLEIVPVDEDQAREARRGFARFGRGRHEAGLNFGDCFAYALAITAGEPLLFKGDDFARTDVERIG